MYVFVAENPQNIWYIGAKHIKPNNKSRLNFGFKRLFLCTKCTKLLNSYSLTVNFDSCGVSVKIVRGHFSVFPLNINRDVADCF